MFNLNWLDLYCYHDSNSETHLPSVPTSPVMSEAMPEPCSILLLLTPVAPALLHNCLISTSHFLKPLRPKNMARWLTSDQEEHTLRSRNNPNHVNHAVPRTAVWTLLIQQNSNAAEGFFFFLTVRPCLSKIFWHNHICYHTSACRSRDEAGVKELEGRKNKERAGNRTTRRACFESPNRLLPSIFRGWNFSLTVRRNSKLRSSCPQPARVEKTSTAHALSQTRFSHPSPPVSSLPAR